MRNRVFGPSTIPTKNNASGISRALHHDVISPLQAYFINFAEEVNRTARV